MRTVVLVVTLLVGLLVTAPPPAQGATDYCEARYSCGEWGDPSAVNTLISGQPNCSSLAKNADGPNGLDISSCGNRNDGGCSCVTVGGQTRCAGSDPNCPGVVIPNPLP